MKRLLILLLLTGCASAPPPKSCDCEIALDRMQKKDAAEAALKSCNEQWGRCQDRFEWIENGCKASP
jgi:hypothetical protein